MFKYFIKNDFISLDQSGFKPGDSGINQLLPIAYDIYNSFDCLYKSRGVFLNISKTFNNVWHDGIIFKENGISGKLHKHLHEFSVNRKQSVILNGQVSSWANVKVGLPQGSILGESTLSYLRLSLTEMSLIIRWFFLFTTHHYFP